MTFVESGGSYMCDASIGSDHSEGEDDEKMGGDCERKDPKCCLREQECGLGLAPSVDVRVEVVVE